MHHLSAQERPAQVTNAKTYGAPTLDGLQRPPHYLRAAAAAGLALALRMVFAEYVVQPYILFYPAVMLAATVGGLGPGLLATGVSALLAWYWVLEPVGHFELLHVQDAVGLVLFTGMGAILTMFLDRSRRIQAQSARDKNARALQEAESGAFRRGEERLRALVENSADMILVIDGEGRMKFRSPSLNETFGRTDEESLGRSLFEYIHPDDKEGFAEGSMRAGLLTTSTTS
jgi:PAS domain-containing protein